MAYDNGVKAIIRDAAKRYNYEKRKRETNSKRWLFFAVVILAVLLIAIFYGFFLVKSADAQAYAGELGYIEEQSEQLWELQRQQDYTQREMEYQRAEMQRQQRETEYQMKEATRYNTCMSTTGGSITCGLSPSPF